MGVEKFLVHSLLGQTKSVKCIYFSIYCIPNVSGSPNGVMANVLDFNLKVRKLELQSHYSVRFQTNIFGNGMKSLIPLTMG